MQKTDLELQEAVIEGIEASNDLLEDYEDATVATAVESFLDALTARGYKIVKDTD